MAEIVRSYVAKELAPLIARIDELESRETQTLADAFQGPWLPQRTYRRGALTQHSGSLWLAIEDTTGKPGESEGWRLLVRAGRDAK